MPCMKWTSAALELGALCAPASRISGRKVVAQTATATVATMPGAVIHRPAGVMAAPAVAAIQRCDGLVGEVISYPWAPGNATEGGDHKTGACRLSRMPSEMRSILLAC